MVPPSCKLAGSLTIFSVIVILLGLRMEWRKISEMVRESSVGFFVGRGFRCSTELETFSRTWKWQYRKGSVIAK